MYLGVDPDGDGPLQAVYEPRESLQWMFRETTDRVVELTDEEWAAVAQLGGSDVASVFATYGRVESAYRRLDVYCVGTQGSGRTTNSGSNGCARTDIDDRHPWPRTPATGQCRCDDLARSL